MLKKHTNHIVITAILLILVIAVFEVTKLDIDIQKDFFSFSSHNWIVNRDNEVLKFIFYDGTKKLLIVLSIVILILLVFFRKKDLIARYKEGLIIVLLSLILVPLFVGSLKAVTNTPCPKNIEFFGGDYPNIKLFDKYPDDFVQPSKIKCWPAGHASGGFALLSLFFLFKSKRNKIIALGVGLVVGWSMGLYKMFIGDHFLSHTIVTMLIAWFITLLVVKLIYRNSLNNPKEIE